jgi:hypothetical protein
MREPNFGEGQLQHSVNSSILIEILAPLGIRISAKVPTPRREHHLGWDTGFYFDWLPHRPLIEHDGCNFFIQYKLSVERSSRAAQFQSWRRPFLRFRIPYRKRGEEDYSQWDRIKELADEGYPSFYCTNSILELEEMGQLEVSGQLLDETPFLDVRKITGLHVYATFTRDSSYFILHSEEEAIEVTRWPNLIEKLIGEEKTNLEEGNRRLYKILLVLGERSSLTLLAQAKEGYPQIEPRVSEDQRHFLLIRQFFYLQWAFQRLFGLTLHKLISKPSKPMQRTR